MTDTAVLFDFRAAPRLDDAVYQQVQLMQARFAPMLQNLFSSRLRQSCDVQSVPPVTLALPEYLAGCIGPTVRFVCTLQQSQGRSMVLALTPNLALHLVARLFGGEGAATEPHPLTPLEQKVLCDLLDRALPKLAEAGRPELPLGATIAEAAGDAAPEIATLGESLVAVTWAVQCGPTEGTLTITLPAAIFAAPVVERDEPPARESLESHVRSVAIPVTARLHVRVPAAQLSQLHEGFLLETGKASHAEVEIASQGRPLFAGVLGRHAGHVGVQITRVIMREPDATTTKRRTPS
ncbi:MAG TPA: FliM/FliN family flagellar motor switch protein [Gemmatimonadales bacterium]|jgi:flagellar motor switch protein FliM